MAAAAAATAVYSVSPRWVRRQARVSRSQIFSVWSRDAAPGVHCGAAEPAALAPVALAAAATAGPEAGADRRGARRRPGRRWGIRARAARGRRCTTSGDMAHRVGSRGVRERDAGGEREPPGERARPDDLPRGGRAPARRCPSSVTLHSRPWRSRGRGAVARSGGEPIRPGRSELMWDSSFQLGIIQALKIMNDEHKFVDEPFNVSPSYLTGIGVSAKSYVDHCKGS